MGGPLWHIGYPKTGTTWLQRNLFPAKAVGLAMPYSRQEIRQNVVRPHELIFDADACREVFTPGVKGALELGLTPVLSTERLSGSIKSGGYDSGHVAARLAAVFPEARVLIVIREQADMIFSTYRQYVRDGGMLPVDRYLRNPGHSIIWPFDVIHFEYDRLIARYHDLFNPDRVLVLPYELFRREPVEFARRIVRFAGSDAPDEILEGLPFGSVFNPGWPPVSIAAKRWLNHVLRQNYTPSGLIDINGRIGRAMMKSIRNIGLHSPDAINARIDQQMKTVIAKTVARHYPESNARTAELVGFDLGELGYRVPSREPLNA